MWDDVNAGEEVSVLLGSHRTGEDAEGEEVDGLRCHDTEHEVAPEEEHGNACQCIF